MRKQEPPPPLAAVHGAGAPPNRPSFLSQEPVLEIDGSMHPFEG